MWVFWCWNKRYIPQEISLFLQIKSWFSKLSTGICLGSDQCDIREGKRSGSCAQGFGVCCVFIISSSDGNQRLEQKVTYLRNTAFPAPNTEDTVQTITLMPRDGDTTQYLLNFLTFKVPGIDNSLFVETNFLGAAFHQIKACLIDDLPSILHLHWVAFWVQFDKNKQDSK